MTAFKLKSMNMRMATDEDAHLPAFDHTKLSAINTCPTWGILRYTHHKRMPSTYRQMALEAGTASHEGFSAVRLFQHLFHSNMNGVKLEANVLLHGTRLFGRERLSQMMATLSKDATERTNCINFVIEAVETCGFYDDIGDRNRTLSNICESLIAYIDAYNMERYPIWIRDVNDPNTDIGIEIPFDIVVDINWTDPFEHRLATRFTGKLDGLHWNKEKLIIIEEKTGARLDDAWLAQWILSHQITGYCLASTTFTGLPCNEALVSGMRLPIGRIPAEGIRKEFVPRYPIMYEKWANWFVDTIATNEKYKDDVLDAPMHTTSCNRYFSSCSFMPLCAAPDIEEKERILDDMELDEWSPLHG
jgi:hypothetical protein